MLALATPHAILLLQILLTTSCSCQSQHYDPITGEAGYDWNQCDILKSFQAEVMSNSVPYYKHFKDPPDSTSSNLSLTPYEAPETWPPPIPYEKSMFVPRTIEAAKATADVLATEECTCAGDIFGPEKRSSCEIYFDDSIGHHLGWCYLRDVGPSMKTCVESLTAERIFVDKDNKPWSYGLCSKGPVDDTQRLAACECSDAGLNPEWGMSRKDYGSTCAVWQLREQVGEGDPTAFTGTDRLNHTRPWCWTGFQTACSDSLNYYRYPNNPYVIAWGRINPTPNEPFTSLSQYLSFQACQGDAVMTAHFYCNLAIRGCALQMAIQLVLTLPIVIILSVFLRNRCSDYLPSESQFTVEFSSSDEGSAFSSEDDSAPAPPATKKGPKAGAEGIEMSSIKKSRAAG